MSVLHTVFVKQIFFYCCCIVFKLAFTKKAKGENQTNQYKGKFLQIYFTWSIQHGSDAVRVCRKFSLYAIHTSISELESES